MHPSDEKTITVLLGLESPDDIPETVRETYRDIQRRVHRLNTGPLHVAVCLFILEKAGALDASPDEEYEHLDDVPSSAGPKRGETVMVDYRGEEHEAVYVGKASGPWHEVQLPGEEEPVKVYAKDIRALQLS